MPLYRDDAVVLRTHKLGEADRIIVLLTRGRGKVRGVAKGVRRTKSKFGSRLEPGSIVQVQLYEGRNLDTITQVQRTDTPSQSRTDLAHYGRLTVLLEIIDSVTVEGESNPALFKLLTGAARELARRPNPMIVPAFTMRLLALEGVQPSFDRCVRCGATEGIVGVNLAEGGVICRACPPTGEKMSAEALEVFRSLAAGRVRDVLDDTPLALQHDIESLAGRVVEQYLERRLKTSAVLYQHLQT